MVPRILNRGSNRRPPCWSEEESRLVLPSLLLLALLLLSPPSSKAADSSLCVASVTLFRNEVMRCALALMRPSAHVPMGQREKVLLA